jgi:hypothetical protein
MQIVMAGFDKVDPANLCCLCGAGCAGWLTDDGRVDLQLCRRIPARVPDEGIAVVGEYALHRRIGLAGKMRVLTS